jgi:glycerol dehydrogenase
MQPCGNQSPGAILQQKGCKGVVGIGGGKRSIPQKPLAITINLTVIPTIASTDAPTSALSVIYTEAGEFEEYPIYPKNPDMVVMIRRLLPKPRTITGFGYG